MFKGLFVNQELRQRDSAHILYLPCSFILNLEMNKYFKITRPSQRVSTLFSIVANQMNMRRFQIVHEAISCPSTPAAASLWVEYASVMILFTMNLSNILNYSRSNIIYCSFRRGNHLSPCQHIRQNQHTHTKLKKLKTLWHFKY